MATRDYGSDSLTVHWDADVCRHSEHCSRTLGSVFRPDAVPWIDVSGAPDDDIARTIEGCPSGALSYTRHDERT